MTTALAPTALAAPLRRIAFGLAAVLALAAPAFAQSPFSPAVTVNDSVVTNYEVDQRARLLEVFRTTGDLQAEAVDQLIDDRIKQAEFARIGFVLTEDGLTRALEDFAGRANLTLDEFLDRLAGDGIDYETLRDYVSVNVTWRDYIRSRFASRVDITDADIDRALGERGEAADGIEILLTEIIIPAPPPRAAEAAQIAEQISQTTSFAAFEAAAREYSALPSRDQGGRLDWLPLSQFPAPLQPVFLELSPGEVTAPIGIPNGIALFQLRDIREVPQGAAEVATIDYAVLTLPGGLSDEGQAHAAQIAARVDVCDDLYGVAYGLPADRLTRTESAPSEIPQDIALELARLDEGEVSASLTRNDGQVLLFVMLCSRTLAVNADLDRETVANRLQSERLNSYADGLLADLRASAIITRP